MRVGDQDHSFQLRLFWSLECEPVILWRSVKKRSRKFCLITPNLSLHVYCIYIWTIQQALRAKYLSYELKYTILGLFPHENSISGIIVAHVLGVMDFWFWDRSIFWSIALTMHHTTAPSLNWRKVWNQPRWLEWTAHFVCIRPILRNILVCTKLSGQTHVNTVSLCLS